MQDSSRPNYETSSERQPGSKDTAFTALQGEIQNIRKDSQNGGAQLSEHAQELNQQLHEMGLLPSLSLETTALEPPKAKGKDGEHCHGEDRDHGKNHGGGGSGDHDHDGGSGGDHDRGGDNQNGGSGGGSKHGGDDHNGDHHDHGNGGQSGHHRDHHHHGDADSSIRNDISNLKKDAAGGDASNSSSFSHDLQNLNNQLHRLGLPTGLNITDTGGSQTTTSPESPPAPVTTSPEPPSPVTTTPTESSGQFTVQNDQIIGPDGKPFIARGIAIKESQAVQDEGALLKDFPGVNMIRLATSPTADSYTGKSSNQQQVEQQTQQFIDDMTKKGIVVEIDDHGPTVAQPPATGEALTQEENWYAKLAADNKNNPYVWFQTPNEPNPENGVPAVVNEEKGVYNAIRDTGNNNMVMLEMASNYTADRLTADPSEFGQYSDMKNVAFDYHMYNRNEAYIQARIASTAPITDTQGKIPGIIGEYGNTDSAGTQVTAAGLANEKAVWDSGLGSIAWAYNNMGGNTDINQLANSSGVLTDYGRDVASYINAEPAPTPPESTPPESTSPPVTTPPESTSPPVTTPPESTTPITTSGQFTSDNGQIIGPDGKPFIAKGIAIAENHAVQEESTILKDFPGINIIRLATSETPDVYTGNSKSTAQIAQETQQFINDMTKRGIVVEFDAHFRNSSTIDDPPKTGAALTAEANWYAQVAAANKNNPYVWYQTPNEPNRSLGDQAVVNEQVAIYNAIRATGNNSMIVDDLTVDHNAPPEVAAKAEFAKMDNIAWDYHSYKGIAPVQAKEAQLSVVTDTQGAIPGFVGEYGNAGTEGTTLNPNANTDMKQVQDSGLGSIAWAFRNMGGTGDINQLTNANGTLTPYGQEVAAYINS